MDFLKKSLDLGTKLGLEGGALREFVDKQKSEKTEADKLAREERQRDRDERKYEAERVAKLDAEREAAKLDAEREAANLDDEHELRKMEMTMKHELKMNRDKLESDRLIVRSNPPQSDYGVKAPPIQPFRDNTMNIQTYLNIF